MVSPTESISAALERNWEMIDSALEGLDEATLNLRPNEQCNSIAWILWHMSRVVDTVINARILETTQLWLRDGWHSRYGMAEDPEDRGVGWTAAQVAAWAAPEPETQFGYYGAVKAAAAAFLASATPAQLEKKLISPPVAEPRSAAAILGQMTWDTIAHGGQIAYLRGFYRGMGWHR